jgi:hypothetical protein
MKLCAEEASLIGGWILANKKKEDAIRYRAV